MLTPFHHINNVMHLYSTDVFYLGSSCSQAVLFIAQYGPIIFTSDKNLPSFHLPTSSYACLSPRKCLSCQQTSSKWSSFL